MRFAALAGVLLASFLMGAGCGSKSARSSSNDPSDGDPHTLSYDVTVGVTNDVGLLGALQFNLEFLGDGGGFAGSRATARCLALVPTALASFNDVGNGVLRAGIIDINGFATPGDVVQCTFKSRDEVGVDDFAVAVVDATDVEAHPKTVEMAVTRVEALD